MVNEESIKQAVDEVGKVVQEEGLNCLINNAAIHLQADFHAVTADILMETFRTNTVAPLMISKVMYVFECLFFLLNSVFYVSAFIVGHL